MNIHDPPAEISLQYDVVSRKNTVCALTMLSGESGVSRIASGPDMSTAVPSFLGLEGRHAFITGGAGGVGGAAAKEFLGKSSKGVREVPQQL